MIKMDEASRGSRSGDVITTGVAPERKTSTVTTVQITPIKASPEIKNAIRRQRRMVGIGYAPSGFPAQRVFKPVHRAVLPGDFQTTSTQYTITTSYSLSGHDVGEDANPGRQHDASYDVPETTTKNSSHTWVAANASFKSGSDVRTLRANNGGYSVIYEKKGVVQGDKLMSPRGEMDSNNLRPTPANLKLTHAPNYQFNMVRSVTSEQLTGRQPMVSKVKPFLDDSRISGEAYQPGNQVFLTQGRRGRIQMSSHGQTHIFSEHSSKTNPIAYMSPGFTDADPPPTTVPPDGDLVIQKEDTPREMPCLDFANSIISAVNYDLNQVYQLCHARVKYSDIIEKAQPHRLSNSATQRWGAPKKPSPVTLGAPNQLSISPPSSTTSSSPLTSPRRSQLFPNLPVTSRRMFPNKSSLDVDTSSWSTTYTGQDGKSSESSQTSAPEPVIDYDKSDTFVIEFNGNVSGNYKKPILKQTLKPNGTSDTYVKTVTGDINNNSSTDAFPAVVAGQGGKSGSIGPSTSTFNLRARRKLSEQTSGSREKGRLVRFDADPKIHEFTPSDPVVTSKLYQTNTL